MGGILTVAVWVVGALAAVAGLFILGMRNKWAVVQTPVKQFAKRIGNPQQLKTAGTPGAYAGVIRHVGRSSGKAYETPVTFERTDTGYVAALPYGPETDWMRNLLAAGEAEITSEGETHRVDTPVLVDGDSVRHWFPDSDLRTLRTMGVEDFVTVRIAD